VKIRHTFQQSVVKIFSARLDAEMSKLGWSAPLLSQATGIRQQTVRRLRHGEREVTASELHLICEALGWDATMVLRETIAQATELERIDAAEGHELDRRLDTLL